MTGRRALLLGLLLTAGCGSRPTPTGSGAKQKGLDFFDAIRRKDWPAAHACTDPASRPKLSAGAFAGLAEHYRQSIGFEPEQVYVTACDEQADTATAHVVIVGHSPSGQRHEDGITLRKADGSWGVVVPASFGSK